MDFEIRIDVSVKLTMIDYIKESIDAFEDNVTCSAKKQQKVDCLRLTI